MVRGLLVMVIVGCCVVVVCCGWWSPRGVVLFVWCRAVRVVSLRPPDADNPLQTDRDTCRAVPLLGERVAERSAVAL